MAEAMNDEKKFAGYEYRDITTKGDLENVYMDGYPHFGWQLEKRSSYGLTSTVLKFKRDRKIGNRSELNKLQHQFDNSVYDIARLEASITTGAASISLIIGFVGTVFMGVSVFSYLGGMIPLCIITAIPGFVGWSVSYFMYKTSKNRRAKKVSPKIEQQYDNIYEICLQAH